MSPAGLRFGLPFALPAAMLPHTLKSVATLLLTSWTFSAVTASAQTTDIVALPKLDAALSASVRNGDSGWQRVIIRGTSNGIPALTGALRAGGNDVTHVYPIINAL